MTHSHGEHNNLKELLKKYELNKPVPIEVQHHYSSRMRKIFKGIAKATGIYTLSFGIGTFFYFFFKKLGIIISTKVMITLSIVASLATGGTITYLYMNSSDKIESPEETIKESHKKLVKKTETKIAPKITYTLGIRPFNSSSVDRKILSKAAKTIRSELSTLQGNSYSKIMRGSDDSIRYIMSGSIEKVDEANILFVRVLDTQSSAIVYVAKETFTTESEFASACKRVSNRIAAKAKK